MMIFIIIFIVLIIVFGVVIGILSSILKSNVGQATSQLDSVAQESAARLAEAKKRMEEGEAHYQEMVQKAKADGEKVKQDLIQEGIKLKQEALDQGHKQAAEIMDRAKSASELLMEDLQNKINEGAQKKALNLIQNAMVGKMQEETHAYWVKELIQNGLDGLSRLNLPNQVDEVEIQTAFPISSAEKTALSEQLQKKLGKAVRFKEKVDPELILGCRFSIGGILVDGTLLHAFKQGLKNGNPANG